MMGWAEPILSPLIQGFGWQVDRKYNNEADPGSHLGHSPTNIFPWAGGCDQARRWGTTLGPGQPGAATSCLVQPGPKTQAICSGMGATNLISKTLQISDQWLQTRGISYLFGIEEWVAQKSGFWW